MDLSAADMPGFRSVTQVPNFLGMGNASTDPMIQKYQEFAALAADAMAAEVRTRIYGT